MRLLLVEDSPRLLATISHGLRKAGYAVDTAQDGTSGLWQAEGNPYDLLILDVMLPGISGFEILSQLRARNCLTHVLMLTARDAIEDRVKGLRLGADDYLIKPFAFDELLARIEALTRRQHSVKSRSIALADMVIDLSARNVRRQGKLIELAPREYAVLEYLVLRRGTVVSRTELEAHIYDARAELASNVVDAAIYALRRRIDVAGRPSLIQTRRGMGYWIANETEEPVP